MEHARLGPEGDEAQRLRSLVDALPVGVYRATPDGLVLEANLALARMLGHARREALLGVRVASLFAEGEAREGETQALRRDGSLLWVRHASTLARDAEGRALWRDGVVQDVTEAREQAERLARRVELERAIAAISARHVSSEDLDRAIDATLADLARVSGASRAYLFLLRDGGRILDNTHEWCAPGVTPERESLQGLPAAAFPWWMAQLRDAGAIHIRDVSELPPEAGAERKILEPQGVRSLLSFAVHVSGAVAGFVGLDNVARAAAWREEDLTLLNVASRILGDSLQRQRHERALRASEERFRDMMEQSPVSTQVFAPDGTAVRANAAWERLWGVRLEDIAGYNILLDPQLRRQGVGEVVERAFAGEVVSIPPLPYVPDRGPHAGREVWAGAVAYPVLDEAGRVREVVVMHNDVTERRRAEQALRESEHRFRHVFEESPVGMLLVDEEFRVAHANAAFSTMLGYRPDELRGASVPTLTHPEDAAISESLQGQLFEGRLQSYRLEKRYLTRRGDYVWGDLTASALRGLDGRTLALGIVEDVTEKRRAEDALRDRNAILQAVIEATNDCVYVKDVQGRYVMANTATAGVFGVEPAEVIGRTDFDFMAPDVAARIREADEAVEVSGETRSIEETVETAIGRRVYSTTKGPYRDHDGTVIGVIGISRDITERKRQEDELEESRQQLAISEKLSALGALVSGVAHEIRTPLTYISNLLFVLDRSARRAQSEGRPVGELAEEVGERVAAISGGVERIERLVESLRGYARVDLSRRASSDLAHVVGDAVELFRVVQRGRVEVDASLMSVPDLMVDREQVQQVVLNLMTNAAEAMGGGGRVRVVVRPVEGGGEVAVEDDGPGLPPEVAKRIFEPFFTTKKDGTGLGLSISRRLVEAHGGTIRCESGGEGRGTTFVVRLPRR